MITGVIESLLALLLTQPCYIMQSDANLLAV